jgi:hypothetical protein
MADLRLFRQFIPAGRVAVENTPADTVTVTINLPNGCSTICLPGV